MADSALAGFDFMKVMEAGIDAKGISEWHQESDDDPDRPFRWHASSLGGCPREQILKRAKLATDGITLKSKLNFEVGHAAHALFEGGVEAYAAIEPRFEMVAAEVGYYHPTMPLASRCDAIIRWCGELVLLELKTEHELASKRRQEDAKRGGRPHSARPEHVLQMHATAMCAEPTVGPIASGRACYISKNNLWTDQVPVDLTTQRDEVGRRVWLLEEMWADYTKSSKLPAPLSEPQDIWKCKARSDTDPKGMWCGARSHCFVAQRKGA